MDLEARDLLGRIPLFADVLSPRQLDELASRSQIDDIARGRVLIAEGDFGSSMFVIIEGHVAVTLEGSRHHERAVATLGPGDLFGEMSLMTGARRSATVTAIDHCRVVEITKVALESLFTRSPELFDHFGVLLEQRRLELDRIHDDEHARRLFGIKTDDIAGSMRRFFGRSG